MTVFAVAVFVTAYGLIASEKVHRVKVALGGAALMLGAGVISFEDAFYSTNTGVDWEVILLLLRVMIIVGVPPVTSARTAVANTAAAGNAQNSGITDLLACHVGGTGHN